MSFSKKNILIFITVALIVGAGIATFFFRSPKTLNGDAALKNTPGDMVKENLFKIPASALAKNADGNYEITDDKKDGLEIIHPNEVKSEDAPEEPKQEMKITLPSDYTRPIEIKLDAERTITVADSNASGFSSRALTSGIEPAGSKASGEKNISEDPKYIKYDNGRKAVYYAYQRDKALGERQLKHWAVYRQPDSRQPEEQESYVFQNAKLKLNEQGEVEVRYFGQKEIQNQQAIESVDQSVLERAQKFIEKELGEDILNNDRPADFVIPEPYYLDKDGRRVTLKWEIDEEKNSIGLKFQPEKDRYPVALDPTLSFTASHLLISSGGVVSGEMVNSYFGASLISGDFNADSKTDLAVGAYGYQASTGAPTGRAYIFYNVGTGSYPASSGSANSILTGEAASNNFGASLISGDFNADSKTDLAVGATGYSTSTGRAYIFYQNSGGGFNAAIAASAADSILTGEAANNYFGWSLASGDFNADSKTDLAVGAYGYSTNTGRAYIFYQNSGGGFNATIAASSANSIITGGATSNYFGYSLISGDFNADAKTDLAVGAYGYSTSTGRAYIFYQNSGGGFTAAIAASAANSIITGGATSDSFGASLSSGDFNTDGKTDLAAGAYSYPSNSYQGRVYVFYQNSGGGFNATIAASAANSIITGETTYNNFGASLSSGDFNSDGKTDLAVGATRYNTNNYTGRAYIFYQNSGGGFNATIAASAANSILTGEATNNYFGWSLASGDFNADSKTDLAVGASYFGTNVGRVYLLYSQAANNLLNGARIISGQTASDNFGVSLSSGDFNSDGKTDLAAGATGYSTSTGRAYIFYNGTSYPVSSGSADSIITGEATSDNFGASLISGDFNSDGKTDLSVGAAGYSTFIGRAYIFYQNSSGGFNATIAASSANSILTGGATSDNFGTSLISGDFNADSKTDLAVGATGYSTSTGRAYIFYQNSGGGFNAAIAASSANSILTGETTTSNFGASLSSGDFNADSKTDLAVGATGYLTNTGRTYIFYQNSAGGFNATIAASAANSIIIGESTSNYFGAALASGDFNADSKTDLAAGAYGYSTNTGRAYIFYQNSGGGFNASFNAATANAIFTGEAANNYLGAALASGDFNSDSKTDLAVGAYGYSTSAGRAYTFYNDGSYPSTAGSADVIANGEAAGSIKFGSSLASGDFNSDGKTDLAVGASSFNYTGGVYILSSQGGQLNSNKLITGEATYNNFGASLSSGDFNSDGKTDLAVGAYRYNNTYTGRAYIFYNKVSYPASAGSADSIITGEATNNYFGASLSSGDFNSDGKTDLAAGAYGYSTNTGRAYIFYQNSGGGFNAAIAASAANSIITGGATSDYFGYSLTSGDFNADSKTDLAVGAYGYSTNTGRAYIFYQNSGGGFNATIAASAANSIITGETTSNNFGWSFTAGDFNSDSKTDLAVGAAYNDSNGTDSGRAYIFYQNSGGGFNATIAASAANSIITGGATSDYFGASLASGDFNADSKTDLAVGATGYSTSNGRAYIFYQNSSGGFNATIAASAANSILTGETAYNNFGNSLISGDFNTDGKTDLAADAYSYPSNSYQGHVYVFYNKGNYPSTAGLADIILTGETTYNYFGNSLISGDFNADGKTDLATGAYGYSTNTGRVYFYESRSDFVWQMQDRDLSFRTSGLSGQELKITGETGAYSFGYSFSSGDFNSDGKMDLAVGATGYSSNTGRAYVFYDDGSYSATAAGTDVVLTGGSAGDYFGYSLASGDFNSDSKTDLAVGATGYSASTGRAYIFHQNSGGGFNATIAASSADTIITGETTSNNFGTSLISGDFNADSKTDLAVGATGYSTSTGRAYIFHQNSSGGFNATIAASAANSIITGETNSNNFGTSLVSGDFNADSKTDLAVGATGYSTNTGRAYIFYQNSGGGFDATIAASAANSIITGETTSNNFGASLSSGDFNSDGKTDLAVGAYVYSTSTGRAYIFYQNSGGGFNAAIAASAANSIITGETTSNNFGASLVSGDFNADSKTDLSVGATGYSTSTGRAYIFYQNSGGGFNATIAASAANSIITGENTGDSFGHSLISGDFNLDGKTDLVIGSRNYNASQGRIYIYTLNEANITGTSSELAGYSLASGDFNADGGTDLAVGAIGYSTSTGRAYIFYQNPGGGLNSATTSSANSIITGEGIGDSFGASLSSGDFNADSKTDLAVGAYGYTTNTGRAYIFYQNSAGGFNATIAASAANSIITGGATSDYFSASLSSGDFNADSKTDLAVGAYGYTTNTGRAYIFYQNSAGGFNATIAASAANSIITGGAASDYFGASLASGDFNADSKMDITVGATGYSTSTGRAYIFHQNSAGGFNATIAASAANSIITGGATSDYFGASLASGDFNADSKMDLAVGAYGYSSSTGRAYISYQNPGGGFAKTIITSSASSFATGEAGTNYFGYCLAAGDFNTDGRADLAIGAYGYSSSNGKFYVVISEIDATPENLGDVRARGTVKFRGNAKIK